MGGHSFLGHPLRNSGRNVIPSHSLLFPQMMIAFKSNTMFVLPAVYPDKHFLRIFYVLNFTLFSFGSSSTFKLFSETSK